MNDDLDSALGAWGADARNRESDAHAPAIGDLLAARRRRHTVTAVAASVVLVAALAVGIGFGLRPDRSASSAANHRPTARTHPMTAPADRSCWSQFADDGTDIEPGTARGVVVLRYLGSRSCRISERPQLAVIDPQGHVVGPHAPPVVMNDEVSVRAHQSIRFTIDVTATCGRPDGVYSVRIYLRPVAAPSASAGAGISLGEQRLARVPCPFARGLTAGSTGPMQVVGDETSRVLKALTGMARQEAADDGDAGASARAVRTTYGRVEHALFGRTPTGSVHNEVWVVELSGAHLAASMCAGDGNCPVSTGTHAVLVFQQPGLRYSDGKINSHSVTLSRLGTVFQLIP